MRTTRETGGGSFLCFEQQLLCLVFARRVVPDNNRRRRRVARAAFGYYTNEEESRSLNSLFHRVVASRSAYLISDVSRECSQNSSRDLLRSRTRQR